MKSIDTSAPRACGRADTTKASMLNAKRIFFIIVRKVTRRSTLLPRDLFNVRFEKRIRAARVPRQQTRTFKPRINTNRHERCRAFAAANADSEDHGLGSACAPRVHVSATSLKRSSLP